MIEETITRKRITLGDIKSLIIDDNYTLLDKDKDYIDMYSLELLNRNDVIDDNTIVNGIYSKNNVTYIILDYKYDIYKELGIPHFSESVGIKLKDLLSTLLTNKKKHIRVYLEDDLNTLIFKIYTNNDNYYKLFCEMSDTNLKVTDVMDYYVKDITLVPDESTYDKPDYYVITVKKEKY